MSEKIEWDLTKNVDPSEKHKVCTVSMISNPQKKFFIIARKEDNELLCNHIHEEKELWNHLQTKNSNEKLCPKCPMKSNTNKIDYLLPRGQKDWSGITYKEWEKINAKIPGEIRSFVWWVKPNKKLFVDYCQDYIKDQKEKKESIKNILERVEKFVFLYAEPFSPYDTFPWRKMPFSKTEFSQTTIDATVANVRIDYAKKGSRYEHEYFHKYSVGNEDIYYILDMNSGYAETTYYGYSKSGKPDEEIKITGSRVKINIHRQAFDTFEKFVKPRAEEGGGYGYIFIVAPNEYTHPYIVDVSKEYPYAIIVQP
jgi:hypothetical protein